MPDNLQSVILIPVPSAENLVRELRLTYDSSASRGIPAHITLLFPFRSPNDIDQSLLDELGIFFRTIKPFTFSLIKVDTFPDVIYLTPNPREPFIDITKALALRYPDAPPYEGKYPSINPHLTIAQLILSDNFEMILQEVKEKTVTSFPIFTKTNQAWLMVQDDKRYWQVRCKFSFG